MSRVRDTLLRMMRLAKIPEEDFDRTTLAELASRLDPARRLETHARCGSCGATYTLQAWWYLAPTGYWEPSGERTRLGQKPTYEGRVCRHCGKELRVPAAENARTSEPIWRQY